MCIFISVVNSMCMIRQRVPEAYDRFGGYCCPSDMRTRHIICQCIYLFETPAVSSHQNYGFMIESEVHFWITTVIAGCSVLVDHCQHIERLSQL